VAGTPEAPRLPPLPPKQWPPAAKEAFAPLLPPDPGDRLPGRPKGLNILGVLARYPEASQAFNTFNRQVLYASTLSARHRELIVLRVAAVRRSAYEWAQHVARADDYGIEPDDVERVAAGPDAAGWPEFEAALLRSVDELLGTARIGDTTWATLATGFDEHQLMDLVFTVGAYDVLAMTLLTFDVALDDDLEGFAELD
jgi:alkylhydroperoxidase family enzyme